MDNTEQLLSQLRDIHLPAAIQAWPWATGRYIILGCFICLLALSIFIFWRYKQRQRRQGRLLHQLRILQQQNDFAEISTLLKRIALYSHPKANVGSLEGEAWLAFLDQSTIKNTEPQFQSDIGRLLLELPYQSGYSLSENPEAITKLHKIIETWIIKNYC
jgi:hypothetical protein